MLFIKYTITNHPVFQIRKRYDSWAECWLEQGQIQANLREIKTRDQSVHIARVVKAVVNSKYPRIPVFHYFR